MLATFPISIEHSATFKTTYFFMVLDDGNRITVYLDVMANQTRETKRHKWVVRGFYSRLNNRDSTIKEEPVVPPNIQQQAVEHVKSLVQFSPWKRG